MKIQGKIAILVVGLLAFAVSSCQKEDMPAPSNPAFQPAPNMRGADPAGEDNPGALGDDGTIITADSSGIVGGGDDDRDGGGIIGGGDGDRDGGGGVIGGGDGDHDGGGGNRVVNPNVPE